MCASRLVDDIFRISWELCIAVMFGVMDIGTINNSGQIVQRLYFCTAGVMSGDERATIVGERACHDVRLRSTRDTLD